VTVQLADLVGSAIDVAVIVAWPPLTDTTWPPAVTVAMYVLLDVQVTVVVALPVTVAVRGWRRSGVSNVYAVSLSVIAIGPTTESGEPPSSDGVPVSVVPASGSTPVSGLAPVSAPLSVGAALPPPPQPVPSTSAFERTMTRNGSRKGRTGFLMA